MSDPKQMSRRAMLTGARGIAVALPFLASLRGESGWNLLAPKRAHADGPKPPQRAVFWIGYWGTLHDLWTPKTLGEGFELNEIMKPLAPVKDKLTVLTGVNMASVNNQIGRAGSHNQGGANMLTSAGFDMDPTRGEWFVPRGPSIDQAIAHDLKSPTAFDALYFGDGSDHNHTVVRGVAGNEPGCTYAPHELFDRLFSGYSPDKDVRKRRRLARTSVLDTVVPGYQTLLSRISATDKLTVDAHLQSIRELEKRLMNEAVCVPPSRPSDPAVVTKDAGPYEDFVDLLAIALACDLSRVVTFGFSGKNANIKKVVPDFDKINPPSPDGNAHNFSHAKWTDPKDMEVWAKFQMWRLGLMTRLAQKLEAMKEADGSSVLDNTCIVHVTDILTGLHDLLPGQKWGYSNPEETPPPGSRPRGMPMFYLGGLGGALKTGTHLDLTGKDTYGDGLGKYSHGELYWTIARAMGVDMPYFGEKKVCNNYVTEILAK